MTNTPSYVLLSASIMLVAVPHSLWLIAKTIIAIDMIYLAKHTPGYPMSLSIVRLVLICKAMDFAHKATEFA